MEKDIEHIHKDIEQMKKDISLIKQMLEQERESLSSALLSEKSLAKDWLSKEEDEAWKDL